MFGKRRASETPTRRPHPDPRTETRLQQIISLRRAAERNEQLLDHYRDAVAKVNTDIRRNSGSDFNNARRHDIDRMNREIDRLNGETAGLHERIAKLTDGMDDTDLAYL